MKTLPLGLHEQNMVLYAGGSALNLLGHAFKKAADPDGFPGFFHGYGALPVGVVLVNACFGVTVTGSLCRGCTLTNRCRFPQSSCLVRACSKQRLQLHFWSTNRNGPRPERATCVLRTRFRRQHRCERAIC